VPKTAAKSQDRDVPARARARTKLTRTPETSLDPSRVVVAIRDNERKIRMCFFQSPDASGFVRLAFRVDAQGAVEKVIVKQSTIDDTNVQECLASRTGELRFGELGAPAKAEWTYVFRLAEPLTAKEEKRAKKKRKKNARGSGVVIERTSPGRIDEARVSSVVEAGYRLFARCYRDAIERDAGLSGFVSLRFVIGSDGRVTRVLDGDSDLRDRMAIDCIAESIFALRFPEPQDGNVHVLYRMQLN
jgi:outer membrane biosynthesis protein TonB